MLNKNKFFITLCFKKWIFSNHRISSPRNAVFWVACFWILSLIVLYGGVRKLEDSSKFEKDDFALRLRNAVSDNMQLLAENKELRENLYSKEHEIDRRRLAKNLNEFYFYLLKYFENTKEMDFIVTRTMDRLFALMANLNNFAEDTDNAAKWHQKVLQNLTERIQTKLSHLQNPENCSTAKILLCVTGKKCGFGCLLHHVAYCFMIAAASNRTLVLEQKDQIRGYTKKGWEVAFLPVGKCNEKNSNDFGENSALFTGTAQTDRIVYLPIIDNLKIQPEHLPLCFPKQFANELMTHHTNPYVYFVGQFVAYLMRPNEALQTAIDNKAAQIEFAKGPIVGIQIRRTDKLSGEASLHELKEYIKWTENWFRIQELQNDTVLARQVFIATDEPTLFTEMREKYPHYKVYGDPKTADNANVRSRYSTTSLFDVIIDIYMLSRCDFLVCTFSSQVCRAGYELMQLQPGDNGDKFHSLDDIYYYGGQHAHDQVAIMSHTPTSIFEFEFKKGDIIGIAGNHWNGYSKGTNKRTDGNGLFPEYKTDEAWRVVDYPIFNDA